MRKISPLFVALFVLITAIQSFAQVGTPTFFNALPTTSTNAFPLNSTTSNKVQWIYAPGTFTTTGTTAGTALSSGNLITKLYIRIQNVNATTIYQPDFSIAMLQTGTNNTFSDGNFLSGLTTVFQSNSFQFTGITAGSWYGITLTTPFVYDPSQSLIIEVKSNLSTSGGNAVNSITTGALNQRIYGAYASATGTVGTGLTPMGFDVIPASACTAPPVAGTATSSVTNVCSGTNFNLGLTGNSTGSGQTYQWQHSTTGTSLWSNFGAPSSSPALAISQTATSFYRCIVTCSSVSDTSTSVQVTSPALISGNFTINNALPTGSGNFQTFAEAISSIACGINGPVTFNVEVGSGPYNEQFTIPQIFGANATNRISIRGNGAIVQFDPPTANRHIIKLDGADYITLDSLDIRTTGTTTTTFGWGIHLTNGADYDSIKNCIISIGSTSATQSNSAGIVASGTSASVTAAGNASNNVIIGNIITGAYQGIILTGTATSLNGVKNQIIRNTIKDFYADGISLTHNDSTIIAFNDVSRPARTVVTTFTGIQLGAGNIKCIVDGNKIHDTHNAATTQTGTAYGVFSTGNDAAPGNENRIINNLIYNFNSGSGIIYGLYNSSSDGVRYYHNTVVLDHSAATAGITRGFYQLTAATNIDFKNNIIFINRGGTGDKHCIYFGTTTSTITSNNNVLYNISSSGTNNGIGSFGTTSSSDLSAWKSANSAAYDQQSISVDPLFTDVNLQNYTPTETAVENIGANVGVSKDINGLSRILAAPDPGAFEVPAVIGIDLRAEQLVSPAISAKGCYNTENIQVSIRNNAATAINFATQNATVTVTVAGAVNTIYTAAINTGTLASGDALNVTVFAPSSTINMSSLGNYNFTVTVNISGDVNPTNNTIIVDRAKLSLTGGTATATPETYCAVGGTPKLTSTDAEGYNSVKWQQSINGGTTYTDITNSDTLIYTLQTAIGQSTYFRMIAVCGTNEQTSTADSVVINNPQILTSQGATRCGPGSVTLTATANGTADVQWYEASTGGTALFTGASFTTPTILSTKTYFAAASEGGSSVSTGIVNAISTTGNNGFTDIGLMFNASVPFTIQSVAIYPIGTGGAGTVTIELRNSANTVLQSLVANVTTAAAPGIKTVVPINFNVPVGTAHRLVVNGVTGVTSLIRESTLANFTYPYTVPGVMSITSSFTGGASSSFYYYFYDWQISSSCEGTRTPVTATITAATSIDATTVDSVICNGASAALIVNSANTNYTYSWTPGAQTNDTINVSPSSTTKYYVNATDSVTNCTALDSVTVQVQPISIINASPASFCVTGDTSILRLSPLTGYAPNTIQWQTSTNNVTYTDIPGATGSTYITPVNSSTTYYKAIVKNGAGLVCSDSTQKISVNNPLIIGTTPATRCGPGSVTLSATANATAAIKWYDAPSGGAALFTGNSFTTPTIPATKTYYAVASEGETTFRTGIANAISTSGNTGYNAIGLMFNATVPFTLESVAIYPIGTGGSATVTIELRNSANTVLATYTANVTTAPLPGVKTIVPLNFNVPAGTNHRLVINGATGLTSLIRESTLANFAYPYTVPGVVSITSAFTGGAASSSFYYYLYDWQIRSGCEGARTPVIATITSAPSITATSVDSVVCNGGSAALTVASTNANYIYSWTSGGQTNDTINVSPSTTTKYYVNATDTVTNCTAIDSVTVRVQPRSSINASPKDFCVVGGVATLTLNPLTGYAPNTIQWQTSSNNVTFTDITGATNATYTSPTINATTYFKAIVKNGAGAVCSDSVKAVVVNNPTIISTTPATRCGSGTLDLSATASAGLNVNWYAASTGGSPLFTGNTFTTPSINSTTNYYATAGNVLNERVGRIAPNVPTTLSAATRGIFFNATQAFILKSVVVYPFAAGSGTVAVQSSTGATLAGPINITWPAGTNGTTPHTISLNMNVPAGNDMFLVMTTMSGNLTYEFGTGFNGTYPYTSPSSIVSITASRATTATPSTTTYYYFYDWEVSTGCESARTLVTATVDNTPGCNALPVSLINFTGIKEVGINRLSWTTTTETNNAGFSIERSADGRNFSSLTYVATKAENGNSTNTINYSFNDVRTLTGNNYYRLKQVDKDGRATYSRIVLIKGDKVRAIMITGLYPNPASSEMKLTVESPSAEKVTVLVTDITGKVVLQTVQSLVIGNNTIQLGVSNLANGSYFVKMICSNGCETGVTKFVKQ